VAALITSLGTVIAAWLQNRHGGPSWRPWNGPETRAGAGLSRSTRPPPPWAESSINTTSPGGAQSRRSSRVASRNPRGPGRQERVYPSSNSPKRKPGKKTAPGAALKRGPGAEVEVHPAAPPSTPSATANASGRPPAIVRAARWLSASAGRGGPGSGSLPPGSGRPAAGPCRPAAGCRWGPVNDSAPPTVVGGASLAGASIGGVSLAGGSVVGGSVGGGSVGCGPANTGSGSNGAGLSSQAMPSSPAWSLPSAGPGRASSPSGSDGSLRRCAWAAAWDSKSSQFWSSWAKAGVAHRARTTALASRTMLTGDGPGTRRP
jgi:hypothetical protein